jgi:uncharacterized protein YegP (UPF0339 family)
MASLLSASATWAGIESVKTNAPSAAVVDLTEQEPAHN